MQFNQFEIIAPIQQALAKEGYSEATPIQELAIPPLLTGRDLLGCAQTGTGKTAAFAIPILQHITENKKDFKGIRPIRCLVLAPTRELALQIPESAYHADLRGRTADQANQSLIDRRRHSCRHAGQTFGPDPSEIHQAR
jgi:superfamily II DNA/RNA helicase